MLIGKLVRNSDDSFIHLAPYVPYYRKKNTTHFTKYKRNKIMLSVNIKVLEETISELHTTRERSSKFNVRLVSIGPWSQNKQINFIVPAWLLMLTHHWKKQGSDFAFRGLYWEPRYVNSQVLMTAAYSTSLSGTACTLTSTLNSCFLCCLLEVAQCCCTGAWFKQFLNCLS